MTQNIGAIVDMIGNHEERSISCYKGRKVIIDTCRVTDYADSPFETGICHRAYNYNDWIIVQSYSTVREAQKGHKVWLKKLTKGKLPCQLRDVRIDEIFTKDEV